MALYNKPKHSHICCFSFAVQSIFQPDVERTARKTMNFYVFFICPNSKLKHILTELDVHRHNQLVVNLLGSLKCKFLLLCLFQDVGGLLTHEVVHFGALLYLIVRFPHFVSHYLFIREKVFLFFFFLLITLTRRLFLNRVQTTNNSRMLMESIGFAIRFLLAFIFL